VADPEADEPGKPLSTLQRAIVDAAVAGAGLRLGGDPGVMASTFAMPFAEEIVSRAVSEFRTDAEQRVTQMLGSAAEELGCEEPDQLGDMISKSERTRLLAITAMDGAIETAWPPRVVAIGRALAAGLIATDDAMVDVEQMALGAMADMEALHVSLLELLACWVPGNPARRGEKMRKYEGPPAHPAQVPNWEPGTRRWNTLQMYAARPQLRPVLTSLIGTLERHGLVVENDNTIQALENFSEASAEGAERTLRGGEGRPTTPVMPTGFSRFDLMRIAATPTWSPTELGERVLSYYRLAAEADQ
jgi:hypothetical protein